MLKSSDTGVYNELGPVADSAILSLLTSYEALWTATLSRYPSARVAAVIAATYAIGQGRC